MKPDAVMNTLRGHAGATLVELLVTMLLIGIVAGSAVSMAVTSGRTSVSMQHVRDDLDNARLGIDGMRREVRQANRVMDAPSGERLRVWLDHNLDGEVQLSEIVTYELRPSGNRAELVRSVGNDADGGRVLARNLLPTSTFRYYPDPPRTQLVDVVLVVDSRGLEVGPDGFTAEGQIRLRNVRG